MKLFYLVGATELMRILPPELLLIVLTSSGLLLVGCGSNSQPQQQATSVSRYNSQALEQRGVTKTDMADQAMVSCVDEGKGVLILVKQLNGSSKSMCQLSNGKRCDERALMQGSCVTR